VTKFPSIECPAHLCIEHLALCAQSVTLLHQGINLLPALQNTVDSLLQHDLGLIQLPLNLQDAVRLLRVLVLDHVILKLWIGERVRGGAGDGGSRVFGQELVADLRQQRLGNGVLFVGDDDTADAVWATVRVKYVC
jgi:hypothetical protein